MQKVTVYFINLIINSVIGSLKTVYVNENEREIFSKKLKLGKFTRLFLTKTLTVLVVRGKFPLNIFYPPYLMFPFPILCFHLGIRDTVRYLILFTVLSFFFLNINSSIYDGSSSCTEFVATYFASNSWIFYWLFNN